MVSALWCVTTTTASDFAPNGGLIARTVTTVAAGGLSKAVEAARAHAGHMVKLEVEVDTLEQLHEALAYDIDAVLLDNMPPAVLREAVALVGGQILTEASGGVDLSSVRAIAESGVDLISIGALTHSAPVLDLGLDFQPL